MISPPTVGMLIDRRMYDHCQELEWLFDGEGQFRVHVPGTKENR